MAKRIRHCVIFASVVAVVAPAAFIIVALLSTFLGTTLLAGAAIRFFYVYSFVPALYLTYPDVSPKLGIPQTAFGIGVSFGFWLTVAAVIGTLLACLHVPPWGNERRSEQPPA